MSVLYPKNYIPFVEKVIIKKDFLMVKKFIEDLVISPLSYSDIIREVNLYYTTTKDDNYSLTNDEIVTIILSIDKEWHSKESEIK